MFTIQKYTLSLITRAINIQYLFDQAEQTGVKETKT